MKRKRRKCYRPEADLFRRHKAHKVPAGERSPPPGSCSQAAAGPGRVARHATNKCRHCLHGA